MSRRRKSKLRPTVDVLQSLLEEGKSPLAQQFKRWKIWSQWPSIVGKEVAPYCAPVGYLRGGLYLWVESPVRMQEMSFLSEPIKLAVNQYMGLSWVKRVVFTLDRKSVPAVAVEHWKSFLDSLPAPRSSC